MSTFDPRVLVRAFNILQEELQRFNQVSSDTLKESEHTQKCAQERFNQASRSSAITLNQAKSDIEDVKAVAPAILRHRIVRNYKADADGISVEKIIANLLAT